MQAAILDTCAESPGPDGEIGYLPFYLALCVDIVENHRAGHDGADPPPETFLGLPGDKVAQTLADRFLKSLPSEAWELWITELSLTPAFDEQAALDLDDERRHRLGRAAWKQLRRYSFVEPQPDGQFRLHKTMRDVLRLRLGDDEPDVHAWFRDHWKARDEPPLAFFHVWSLDPEGTLNSWLALHASALKARRIQAARTLLDDWSEIPLDGLDRQRLGHPLWARTHCNLAVAIWKTPIAPLAPSLNAAVAHNEAALLVFTEADFPADWAMTQYNLGNAFLRLPTGDRGENLRRAIACYDAALRIWTEADFPAQWAMTQNNLGTAYGQLPTGDRGENLRRAIECFDAALRVYTEADFPARWAMTQFNLGLALRALGDLDGSIDAFERAAHGCASVGYERDAQIARDEAEESRRRKGE